MVSRSRYAIDIPLAGGHHLLFNTSNGSFAELDETAYGTWESCASEGETAAALLSLGLLTEADAEGELAELEQAFVKTRTDKTHLTLSIVPTYVCNFRCPYCYEIGHNKVKGAMDERTIDALMNFVSWKREQDGFDGLSVQWYGGDPTLALDVVEELSGRLVSWCDDNGITYDAVMLTNANVVDEEAADLIARCRVESVFLTIDGPEDLHNKRRVAANGSNSFAQTLRAARLFQERNIHLFANMNADKVNLPLYNDLREELYREAGIVLTVGKLNDYGHFYGEAPFCSPDFELFTHEEFFQAQLGEFEKVPHDAEEMREMLTPARRFCTGQLNNYFVIDLLGDVYNCDGRVGEAGYARFNLFDDKSTWKLDDITFDPFADEKCRSCELLPLCFGNCIWERQQSGMPCHPFKTTIGGYLQIYRDCIREAGEPRAIGGLEVLAEPLAAE